jgi:acetyl-CoA acetyltransferase
VVPVREVEVVGVGMTPFARRPERPSAALAAAAVLEACGDAAVAWGDVQQVVVGAVGVPVSAASGVLAHLPPTGLPAVAVENASATGSSALAHAVALVAGGHADLVAAVGYGSLERLLLAPGGDGPPDPVHASGTDLPPVVFALLAQLRAQRHGDGPDATASVVVKNRRNAAANARAQRRSPVALEEVAGSPVIAEPIHALECCPMGDGGAAVLVAPRGSSPRGVPVLASESATDRWHPAGAFLPSPDTTAATAGRALQRAGLAPSDLDVVEVHDAFAVEELEYVEAIGLCPPGAAAAALAAGELDIGGRVAVSPSGGLLGRGHPGGATGLAQVVEVVEQLRGEAGERQHAGARHGLTHMIGAGGVCVVHVFGPPTGEGDRT